MAARRPNRSSRGQASGRPLRVLSPSAQVPAVPRLGALLSRALAELEADPSPAAVAAYRRLAERLDAIAAGEVSPIG